MSVVATEPGEDSEAAPDERDHALQALLDRLVGALGDAVVGHQLGGHDLWVRVRADAWGAAAEACRHQLGMDYFCFLSGIDWMPATAPNPEAAAAETVIEGEDDDESVTPEEPAAEVPEPVEEAEGVLQGWKTGVAGGETRFQVFARLMSTTSHLGLTLKADLDEEDPRVDTWVPVYAGANWHERETWEMYGFTFVGHPNLTHLYLPSEFEGFPLRKDFPLLAREVKPWPGLVDVEPMPEEPEVGATAEAPAPAEGGEAG